MPGAVGDRPSKNGRRQNYRLTVQTRSGELLRVSFAVARAAGELRVTNLVLEGPAVHVFDGTVSWPHEATTPHPGSVQ